MQKCYECGSNIYHKYKFCPGCGKSAGMCVTTNYYMKLSKSGQANRIEAKLDLLLKHFKIEIKEELKNDIKI